MKVTDEELLKYADGTLDRARVEVLQKAAQGNPQLAESMEAMQASQLPYQAAFEHQFVPSMPDELRSQVHNLVSTSQTETATPRPTRLARIPNLAAAAACVVASFAAGFVVATRVAPEHSVAQSQQPVTESGLISSAAGPAMKWVQRVADYHSLYVPNTIKNIDNGLPKAQSLLSELTEEQGIATGIPDLSASGYEFVRAQELGYENKVLVQLVYQKDGKLPLALCHMPSDDKSTNAFSFAVHHELGTAYWTDKGQQFVIVAEESEQELKQLFQLARTAWL